MKLRRFVARSRMPAPAEDVFGWHARPGAFDRLLPPWEAVKVVERPAGVEVGARAVMWVPAGPIAIRWIARHTACDPDHRFMDEQVEGPFAHWVHEHLFLRVSDTTSVAEDRVEYAHHLGAVGGALGERMTRRRLRALFAYRHGLIAGDLERHAPFRDRGPLRVAVSGASGLIGSALCAFLSTGGHQVHRLVRPGAAQGPDDIPWNPVRHTIDPSRLDGLDTVIHLAGDNIARGRWTPAKKARIRDSRVEGTRFLAETLAALKSPPKVFLCASAIGIYGNRGSLPVDESAPTGDGFLPEVGRAWEAAADPARERGIRTVHLRFGIVLAAAGGALAKMRLPFRLGLGGPQGRGRQFQSWVELNDALATVHFAMMHEGIDGPVNVTAPEPVTNLRFARTLGRVLGRPAVLPLPGLMIRALFGEMGRDLLLGGTRVLPRKLADAGFRFRFTDLESALRFQLGRLEGSYFGVELSD